MCTYGYVLSYAYIHIHIHINISIGKSMIMLMYTLIMLMNAKWCPVPTTLYHASTTLIPFLPRSSGSEFALTFIRDCSKEVVETWPGVTRGCA